MNIAFLKKIGFSDKSAQVYLALLQRGPSSVRNLAEATGINRGTAYDALKALQEWGLVSFHKKDSKQHFVAEHPEKLKRLVREKHEEIDLAERAIEKALPELTALHHKGGDRPVARYFNAREITEILEDVLKTCEQSDEKSYSIYSAEGMRKYLYQDFPTFSDVRISKGIEVQVIAIGDGGELRGLDERKWLKKHMNTPTYIFIYPGKTASISLNAHDKPVGVVIENDGVYEAQKAIFDALWETL